MTHNQVWLKTDRADLRERCTALIAAGGSLVVVGDQLAGREEAADIVEETFKGAGLNVYRALERGDRSDALIVLLREIMSWAASILSRDEPGFSVAASNVGLSVESTSRNCLIALQHINSANSNGFAIVLTSLGRTSPPGIRVLEQLRRLVENAGGCWVAIGRDHEEWHRLCGENKVTLRKFTRQEVAQTVREIVLQAGIDQTRTSELLEEIFESGDEDISPLVAYAHLKNLTSGLTAK